MNPDYKQIGKRIRMERLEANLSQAALAEAADVSPQYICLVENGKKQLSLTVLVRIASALSVSMDWILTGSPHDTCIRDATLSNLLSGCNSYERKVVLDIAAAAKRSLTENRRMLDDIV